MKIFVTGAMGFLGHHLVGSLIREHDVTVYDRKPKPAGLPRYDITTGTTLDYIVGDVMDDGMLSQAMCRTQPQIVFHLAALADVRNALKQRTEQLDMNLIATFHVLEAMRQAECSRIAFTSTAVVYGNLQDTTDVHLEWPLRAIRETGAGFPQQTSIYGAMKLASESLIAAYCEGFGLTADIYRLVSVVGAGYRHGNLVDFYRRLKQNPQTLTLFGSPTQQKYYIAVQDVIAAMRLTTARLSDGRCELWNVSHHAPNTIGDSVSAVAEALGIPYPSVLGGESWPGDLPQLVLDCSKLRALGWVPNKGIQLAMRETVEDLIARGV